MAQIQEVVYLESSQHKNLRVQTKEEVLHDCMQDLRRRLRQEGRPTSLLVYRSLADSLKDLDGHDVEALYWSAYRGEKDAKKFWRKLCDEVVFFECMRQVLFKRQLKVHDSKPEWETVVWCDDQ